MNKDDIVSRVSVAVSVAGIAVLAFLGGAMVNEFELFPDPLLDDAFTALKAQKEKHRIGVDGDDPSSVLPSSHWRKTRFSEFGITHHDPDRTIPDLTFNEFHRRRRHA